MPEANSAPLVKFSPAAMRMTGIATIASGSTGSGARRSRHTSSASPRAAAAPRATVSTESQATVRPPMLTSSTTKPSDAVSSVAPA